MHDLQPGQIVVGEKAAVAAGPPLIGDEPRVVVVADGIAVSPIFSARCLTV